MGEKNPWVCPQDWRDWRYATVNEVAPKGDGTYKSLIDNACQTTFVNDVPAVDRVKLSVNELSWDDQHEVYDYLYTIGHRKF